MFSKQQRKQTDTTTQHKPHHAHPVHSTTTPPPHIATIVSTSQWCVFRASEMDSVAAMSRLHVTKEVVVAVAPCLSRVVPTGLPDTSGVSDSWASAHPPPCTCVHGPQKSTPPQTLFEATLQATPGQRTKPVVQFPSATSSGKQLKHHLCTLLQSAERGRARQESTSGSEFHFT